MERASVVEGSLRTLALSLTSLVAYFFTLKLMKTPNGLVSRCLASSVLGGIVFLLFLFHQNMQNSYNACSMLRSS